jgi:hypothetical protein
MQPIWKYVIAVAALAVSLAMAVSTEAKPHMHQHRKMGALNRGAVGLSKIHFLIIWCASYL